MLLQKLKNDARSANSKGDIWDEFRTSAPYLTLN